MVKKHIFIDFLYPDNFFALYSYLIDRSILSGNIKKNGQQAMLSKIKKRLIFFLVFFIVTVGAAGITVGQENTETAVSREALQRCVENKKREARRSGAAAFDLMDIRYACYQEIIRGKKY